MKVKKSVTLDTELAAKIEERVRNKMAPSFSEVLEFLAKMGFVALEALENEDA